MSQFRISEVASLLGVSSDTVRRWVRGGKLNSTIDATRHQVIAGAELAVFAKNRVEAQPAHSTSARNQLRGLVTDIHKDSVMSQVEMHCGPFRIVSLMSTEALKDLGLKVGDRADALVKATTVIVERV
ncbi:MAG: TOBE domain-containing protein [Actinomycetaceae bacterium]|nr:TOBE domain-containing protein [Actinomycetaceae bacterium]